MGLPINEVNRTTEDGATATEYVFLLVFIAIAIAVGAAAFGSQLGGSFKDAGEQVQTAVDGSS